MATSTLSDVRREAARIDRAIPEIERRADSLRDLQVKTEQARLTLIQETAKILRACDSLIEIVEALPPDNPPEPADLLGSIRARRAQAFEKMNEANPDQAWFWTEEWQAGERAVDRDIAAGIPRESGTGEEFIAALKAMMAERT